MALAPQFSAFEILDLRHLRARSLEALLEEEQRMWREEMHWDYRPSVELIRKHVEAQNLPGYVAMSHGQVVGYCFYVYEDCKGMVGDLYVLEAHRGERPHGGGAGIASLLLEHVLETLEETPTVRRIEAQLIPARGTEPLAPLFAARGFQAFPRLFMYRPLAPGVPPGPDTASPPGAGEEVELRAWEDRYFEAMADLIAASYRGHVDGRINDQYSSRPGAMRFLKNIVIFPGCGAFQPDCSFVAVPPGSKSGSVLVGAVLASQVGPRVGHITQICLRPEWQGHGLGRRLMEAAMARLARKGYTGLSLTVTAENQGAVELYRRLGLDVIREFNAFARTLEAGG